MANDLTVNPLFIDAEEATVTGEVYITSIIVTASADTWAVVLHDKASGNVIFKASSDLANHRTIGWSPATPFKVSGIYATTLTDISDVLIYTCSGIRG